MKSHFLKFSWRETLGVYRVDLEIMQRHIFDFRFRPQTDFDLKPISTSNGSRLFFGNRKLKTSLPEVIGHPGIENEPYQQAQHFSRNRF